MGRQLRSLDDCLTALQRFATNHQLGPEAELIGINQLRDQSEILEFVSEYKAHLREVNAEMKDRNNKGKNVRKLIRAGYSMDDIAEFQLQDGLLYTLGHINNQRALQAWYAALEERWQEKDQEHFSNMYKVIRA